MTLLLTTNACTTVVHLQYICFSDLTAQTVRLSKQVDEYKAIAEGSECQLEEQSKVMKSLEEQMSANIAAERESEFIFNS